LQQSLPGVEGLTAAGFCYRAIGLTLYGSNVPGPVIVQAGQLTEWNGAMCAAIADEKNEGLARHPHDFNHCTLLGK
jgi:hypothetical protein